MKKTLMYYVTIILSILLILVSTYSYAAEITKESLTKFFKEFVEKETNEGDLKGTIEVTDTEIIIKSEEEEYNVKYDLTDKPAFSTDIKFKNSMTYDECIEEASKLSTTLFGFMAVAGINGVDATDAMIYGIFTIMEKEFEQNDEETTITEETFIDAFDYAKKCYSKDVIIDDNLFIMTIKKAELKGEEYVVNTDLVVNKDDFSVIEKENLELKNSIGNEINNQIFDIAKDKLQELENEFTEENDKLNQAISLIEKEEKYNNSTANIGTMPNAGFELNTLNILKIVLGLSLVSVIVYSIYSKRYSSK